MDFDTIREELIAGKAVLLDVREKEEWKQLRLSLSTLFPLSELKKGLLPLELSKKKIYVHCRKGGRAQEAATILKKAALDATPILLTIEELKKMNF